jgi:hypothetical protein
LLESGPTPLGPFVYVWQEDKNVNTVICRCMPSRVTSIPTTATYDLAPLGSSTTHSPVRDLWAAQADRLETALRLTTRNLAGSLD